MKRIVYLVIILLVLNYVRTSFIYYKDPFIDCKIRIATSFEFSNKTIKAGMRALKFGQPEVYKEVCAKVKIIDTATACGGFGGGCYRPGTEGRIYVSTAQGAVLESAAIIVHELCHLKQQEEGRPFEENECYAADDVIFSELAQFEP